MTTMIDVDASTSVTRQMVRRVHPRARQTALAIGAGAVTAVVMVVASTIAGHWG